MPTQAYLSEPHRAKRCPALRNTEGRLSAQLDGMEWWGVVHSCHVWAICSPYSPLHLELTQQQLCKKTCILSPDEPDLSLTWLAMNFCQISNWGSEAATLKATIFKLACKKCLYRELYSLVYQYILHAFYYVRIQLAWICLPGLYHLLYTSGFRTGIQRLSDYRTSQRRVSYPNKGL